MAASDLLVGATAHEVVHQFNVNPLSVNPNTQSSDGHCDVTADYTGTYHCLMDREYPASAAARKSRITLSTCIVGWGASMQPFAMNRTRPNEKENVDETLVASGESSFRCDDLSFCCRSTAGSTGILAVRDLAVAASGNARVSEKYQRGSSHPVVTDDCFGHRRSWRAGYSGRLASNWVAN
jgi:hypothetical protein